ncbi:MAG: polymerase III subunit beta protein [Candidatus Amesbacteria bacterium GW2011_GWB1_47_19]|nr:MAG: polymerase III subunit beta protein [Candidatus Amesbacteria bacterium GW2011_GWA1_44_24]KKU32122.1 MAG: polymerase III, beta subunit, DNA polymerase III subunit beta protein [Candidatus Amesbacteria bacterium GW2011_GWC1_46_24]KKU67806.1 MAG: polymerase III subunit beta protein [Candidatus Amesbacteria bacterium GW2011_GWB1_47_19]OGD06006.1 MAG: DNA polymerase III subunit beta [Candidatus Amesbacteria bacterium RIFOXYB1_FULL_47_13]HBC72407.1 DNA polymerase III subunit beta [Candidatus 
MKAIILQENLSKSLGLVGRVVSSRGQMPVLGNVLIEATKVGLVLSATNLEMGLRVEAGGKVTEEGGITVPAKNLAEYAGSLESGNVELTGEGEKLKVKGGKSEATFAGIAATEFPVIPRLNEKTAKSDRYKISRKIVLEIAQQVAFAAAGDESRPVLTGIKLMKTETGLTAVATDGFRLSRKRIDKAGLGGGGIGEAGLILPARTILELARLASESKGGEIIMEKAEENNQVIFGCDGIQLVSRILEGNFPDVEKIIPVEKKTSLTADRENLLRAVRSASIFARDNSNIIRFKMDASGFKITASAQQTGESEIELEAEKEGEDVEIAFNYRYVIDFLGSTDIERVRLVLNGNLAPGVWSWEGDESLIHLIMPVRV